MRGDLQESVQKGDKTIVRKMRADRHYTNVQGGSATLRRALMFVRNVGHLANPHFIQRRSHPRALWMAYSQPDRQARSIE